MNHPPFGPSDLQGAPLPGQEFLQLLHKQRGEKYPDPPGFYQAVIDGSASREHLQAWVKNAYYYWDHGLQYSTGAILAKTSNEEVTRIKIIKKLVNVEGKDVVNHLNGATTPSYSELWFRFGEALGLDRDAVTAWKPFTRSYFAVEALCTYSRWWEWTWLDGIASFYSADLVAQEYTPQIYSALQSHYGLSDQVLEFFPNYIQDAKDDIPWEEETLAYWACTKERQLTAARAFRNRLDIEYQHLLPLQALAVEQRVPVQVP